MSRPSVRGKLVEAAIETLHSRGFNGCSIQDITDAAGVPKGSFFNHFKSKELLALEVLDHYREGSRVDLLFDKDKSPLERLRQHFEFLADRYNDWDFKRGCMMVNYAWKHPRTAITLSILALLIFWQWYAEVPCAGAKNGITRLRANNLGSMQVMH